jgi:hypothetical protein
MDFEDKFKLIGVAVALLLALIYGVAVYSSQKDITCTVTSIDRVSDGSGGSDSRIYTKDCGVLKNADSWMFFKFDSADVQAKIVPGSKQTFHVAGFRIPFFSNFPNIIEVK